MKQDIRGLDTVIHSDNSLENIILNIMPKYTFSQNVISFNFMSINNNTGFQIIDIEYEYSYVPLSSSKRDEDSTSDFDWQWVALQRSDTAVKHLSKTGKAYRLAICNDNQLRRLHESGFVFNDYRKLDIWV